MLLNKKTNKQKIERTNGINHALSIKSLMNFEHYFFYGI